MRRMLLLYHPHAGDAIFRHRLDQVVALFQQAGILLTPIRTVNREETLGYFSQRYYEGFDGVVAAGGDGTLHHAVEAMLQGECHLPLGILPAGTSNDFARGLGIPLALEQAVQVIAAGHTRLVDVGQANERYFINVVGAGLLPSVAHSVDRRVKNTLGRLAYYLKGIGELPNIRPFPLHIETEQQQIAVEDALMLLVLNSGDVGGFSQVLPDIQVDDGLLDIVVLSRPKVTDWLDLLLRLTAGEVAEHKNILHLRCSQVTVCSTESVECDFDGEAGGFLPVTIRVLPRRLRFYCPHK